MSNVLILTLLLASFLGVFGGKWKTPLTSVDFKEVFVKRCMNFGNLERTPELYKADSFKRPQCETIWKQFKASVGYKDPCALTVSDYSPFIKFCNSLLLGEDQVYRNKVSVYALSLIKSSVKKGQLSRVYTKLLRKTKSRINFQSQN